MAEPSVHRGGTDPLLKKISLVLEYSRVPTTMVRMVYTAVMSTAVRRTLRDSSIVYLLYFIPYFVSKYLFEYLISWY